MSTDDIFFICRKSEYSKVRGREEDNPKIWRIIDDGNSLSVKWDTPQEESNTSISCGSSDESSEIEHERKQDEIRKGLRFEPMGITHYEGICDPRVLENSELEKNLKEEDRNKEKQKKAIAAIEKTIQDMRNGLHAYSPKKKNKSLCTPTQKKFSCNFVLFFIVFSFLIGMVSIILQQGNNRHSSDFVDAIVELNKRIYGQQEAVEALSEYLLMDQPAMKVIALVGGTGVGKSYTVEIIKENFPRKYYVSQLFPPITSTNAVFILHPQLIIVENLREQDLSSLLSFLKTLQKNARNKYITILTVFNVERMDENATRSIKLDASQQKLKNFFALGNIDAEVIAYHPLSEDTLDKCITDATERSGLILSNKQIDLVKQYLFTHNAGCKGAYAKVQVIGRQ